MQPKQILVAPMDWGLGHATRCIPLIRMLLKKGCHVCIASGGSALTVLIKEFPDLPYFPLPSYRVRYSSTMPFMVNIFLQIPKFILVIFQEHRRLHKIIAHHAIDIVISDNRYGCWSPHVVSVFITHQINILMPRWLNGLIPLVRYFNYRYIRRFDRCWIPDEKGCPTTGDTTAYAPVPIEHIGMLSRFAGMPSHILGTVKWDLTAILSGPEPQRTIFEKKIMTQLEKLSLRALVVRGIPEGSTTIKNNPVQTVDYLDSHALRDVIEKSSCILCRSGYSSIMDLAALGKKALFVPTPGQTEQEYLADRLKKAGIAPFQHQNQFDLESALKEINQYTGFVKPEQPFNLLSETLDKLLYESMD